jgi:hypothetical protein
MSGVRSALVLCGSPKGNRGASWSFGSYLGDKLEALGVQVRRRGVSPEATLLQDVASTDLLVLTFPLYADGVPAGLKRALMRIAAAGLAPCKLAAIVNCGFLESNQTDTALEICRLFAHAAGYEWMGGLGRGGGGALGDKKLSDAGGLFLKTRRSLDFAAQALAQGRPVPQEAIELMRANLMPRWLYFAASNLGHLVLSVRNGILFRVLENPYWSDKAPRKEP